MESSSKCLSAVAEQVVEQVAPAAARRPMVTDPVWEWRVGLQPAAGLEPVEAALAAQLLLAAVPQPSPVVAAPLASAALAYSPDNRYTMVEHLFRTSDRSKRTYVTSSVVCSGVVKA
jgi:hypothetical protein